MDCETCGGDGEIFAGNKTGFNASTMEIFADEEYEPCPDCSNGSYDKYDDGDAAYDAWKDEKHDRD
jgi:hypothetical protein